MLWGICVAQQQWLKVIRKNASWLLIVYRYNLKGRILKLYCRQFKPTVTFFRRKFKFYVSLAISYHIFIRGIFVKQNFFLQNGDITCAYYPKLSIFECFCCSFTEYCRKVYERSAMFRESLDLCFDHACLLLPWIFLPVLRTTDFILNFSYIYTPDVK